MKVRTATHAIKLIGLLAAATVFAASGFAQSIEGKYKIVDYGFADKRAYPLEKLEVTLNIDRDLKFGGRSACNLYSGTLVLGPGKTMKLGRITSTDMACQELPGSFEGEFMNVLSSADRYESKGGTLTLTDSATGHFLRFQRLGGPQSFPPAAPPDPPEGGKHEIFYVSKTAVKCPIIAPMRCMLVKHEPSGMWEKYYDEIIGFNFRPGKFYKIEVERVGDKPSGLPGDVTVYRHKLVRIVKTSRREKDIYR